MRSKIRFPLVVLVLVILVGWSRAQVVLNVPGQFATIQGAVNAAGNGDKVRVAPGIYFGTLNLGSKPILLEGSGPGQTVLQGLGGPVLAAVNTNGHTVIRGFTITGGTFSGLFMDGASPVIENCHITGNSHPTFGGGISTESGQPVFINCLIEQNAAVQGGGGVDVDTGVVTLIGCTLRNNTAPAGAAIHTSTAGNSLRVINCIFDGNNGTSSSVRIRAAGSSSFENCTFFGNTGLISDETMSVDLRSSIVFQNTPATPQGFLASFSNVQGGMGGNGNINLDPMFTNAPLGNFTLQTGSPCIDSGDPSADPELDGTLVDMGFLAEHIHLTGSALGNVFIAPFGFMAPFAQLRVDGSTGGPSRRVYRQLSTPFTISLIDPPGFPSLQPVAIAFHVGAAGPTNSLFLPNVGEFAFNPVPSNTILIVDGFGGPSVIGPAFTPAFVAVPFGVGFPITGVLQALYLRGGAGAQLRATNALVLHIF